MSDTPLPGLAFAHEEPITRVELAPLPPVSCGGSGIERKAARELGVRRFLVKPCEVDELVLAIREELGRERHDGPLS